MFQKDIIIHLHQTMMPVQDTMCSWDALELLIHQLIHLYKMSDQFISGFDCAYYEIGTHFLLVGTFLELRFPFFKAAKRSSTGAI